GWQSRAAPARSSVGSRALGRLLVGFAKEPHVKVIRRRILTNRDSKFDGFVALPFVHQEKVEQRQLVCRVGLRESPFRHGLLLLKETGLGRPVWNAEMRVGKLRRDAAAGCALKKADLKQVRLVDVFDS